MARFSLWGVLGLRDSNFQSGMKRAKASTQDFTAMASRLKGVLAGAFSIVAITRYSKMMVDHVQRIKDLSSIYRQTTDRVQEVDFAAAQTGLRFEDIASAMDQVEVKRQRAVQGNEKLIETFKRLGFSMEEIQSSESMLELLIQRFAGAKASAGELAALFELLPERAGKVLATMENIGAVDISLISEAEINRLDRAAKQLQNMMREVKQVSTIQASRLFGGLEGVSQFFGSMTGAQGSLGSRANTAAFQTVFSDIIKEGARKASSGIAESFGENRKPGIRAVSGALMDHPQLPESPARERLRMQSSVDALTRIGGFTGAAAKDPGFSIEKEQLRELKGINKNTQPRPGQTAIF